MFELYKNGKFVIERLGLGEYVYKFKCGEFHSPGLSEEQYHKLIRTQKNEPVLIFKGEDYYWWMYGDLVYYSTEIHSADQFKDEYQKFANQIALGLPDEKSDIDFLNILTIDSLKLVISKRKKLSDSIYSEARREYDDWLLKGREALKRAASDLLKPGEDVSKLKEHLGQIPTEFIDDVNFENSSLYRKYLPRFKKAERNLSNVKNILVKRTRNKYGLPETKMVEENIELTRSVRPKNVSRESIPEEVRIYVWKRDEGKCVKCGSREKLEYDHIIPVSKGGSNTARNVQLLCEPCNRSKSDSI